MPKAKRARRTILNCWIEAVQDKSFTSDGQNIYCGACKKQIFCERKSQVTQHANTTVHKINLSEMNKEKNNSQNTDATCGSKKNQFYMDLCQAMVAINMPWRNLDNKHWRNFLQKYTNQHIPDESTLRKSYLEDCYNMSIRNIQTDIADNCVWISVDETTDAMGRNIANVIIGKMCEDEPSTPHLLACKQLEKTNHATIARFVNAALQILWPTGGEEKVLLLLTDAASYMLKAGEDLKIFYPHMLHLTCLAHGLHRVAEEVRLYFPSVNKLISSVKKVFLKAPLRVERYKERLENVPLPPEPVITRWGTWLKAAMFYATHLDAIKEIIQSFDSDDAASIASAQEVLKDKSLCSNLAYIKTHFGTLPVTIEKLETVGLPLTESIDLINGAISNLKCIPGKCGQKISLKLDSVLKRNKDFLAVLKISQILEGASTLHSVEDEIPQCHWSKFKYAPVTSCDVERSFSAFKHIFSEKRHQFSLDNLEKTIVVYCNLNYV